MARHRDALVPSSSLSRDPAGAPPFVPFARREKYEDRVPLTLLVSEDDGLRDGRAREEERQRRERERERERETELREEPAIDGWPPTRSRCSMRTEASPSMLGVQRETSFSPLLAIGSLPCCLRNDGDRRR